MAKITTNTAREARADAIEGLRHIADILEANPHVPVPHRVSWWAFCYQRTQSERFTELHDLADALGGVPVMENPVTGERSINIRFGTLTLAADAEADRPKPEPEPTPRPVARPVQRPVTVGGE